MEKTLKEILVALDPLRVEKNSQKRQIGLMRVKIVIKIVNNNYLKRTLEPLTKLAGK